MGENLDQNGVIKTGTFAGRDLADVAGEWPGYVELMLTWALDDQERAMVQKAIADDAASYETDS